MANLINISNSNSQTWHAKPTQKEYKEWKEKKKPKHKCVTFIWIFWFLSFQGQTQIYVIISG